MSKHHPSLDGKPEMGFHGLKDLFTTREYLQEYCEFLTSCMHEAAWATRGAAYVGRRSVRGHSYLGRERKPGAILTHPEVQYERAMHQKWSQCDAPSECGWQRVIDYQVPVSDRKPSLLGLRAIDLLAVNASGLPVVIELKIVRGQGGADTPLRALLEAAAYGCVLQADWAAMRSELLGLTGSFLDPCKVPEKLTEVPLVVAGPPEYWDFWNNPARRSSIDAGPAFCKLVEAFGREGFPIYFTCVEGPTSIPEQLIASRAPFLEVV